MAAAAAGLRACVCAFARRSGAWHAWCNGYNPSNSRAVALFERAPAALSVPRWCTRQPQHACITLPHVWRGACCATR